MQTINKFFNVDNESKFNELTIAKGELNSKESDLQSKLSRVERALELAQTDLMIDDSTANKKVVVKYEEAQEKFQLELTATQEELNKISDEIAAIVKEELHAELVDAAKQDVKRIELPEKCRKAKKVINSGLYRDGFLAAGDQLSREHFGVGATVIDDARDFSQIYLYAEKPNLTRIGYQRGELIRWGGDNNLFKLNDEYEAIYEEEAQKIKDKTDKEYEQFMKAFNKYFAVPNFD
ncbi:hypothetical protein [Bacillus wiedmannii]|uniref:hypothetical protein n=1 Tax=Bacillus wiedmannii TaxID=1890302 RepID=UPI000BF70EC7|nr:hypothetical protein [Bacillus wiedmannii]PFZ87314.1 hypothetical protein COL83_26005 [Bacillus wiedmannii]